jgi:5-methylcytosine-specific restriction endonuclease McrA
VKVCVDCLTAKPEGAFYGRSACCKPCHNARSKAYRAANSERLRAAAQRRYRANPEPVKARVRRWREEHLERARAAGREREARNPEAAAERKRRWAAAHPEKTAAAVASYQARNRAKQREWTRRRRARLKTATVEPVDYEAIRERDGDVCYLCGDSVEPHELDFDHVIPLSRGGAHSASNVRVTHASCNRRKGARTPSEYLTALEKGAAAA